MDPNEPKDANVYSFMMQLVQEKHGDDVSVELLNTEAERLYIEFGDLLVDSFEPMLSSDQKAQFDALVAEEADQEMILTFLTESIDNLEQRILDTLMNFRENYLSEIEE